MSELALTWFSIGQNLVMAVYTLWVISLGKGEAGLRAGLGLVMLGWLGLLHIGLSSKALFPADISGGTFLVLIVAYVGIVGGALFVFSPMRRLLLSLGQQQLLLLQGIRVFFGAGFLMQASLGSLPAAFGILDGWTHIAAGFFGLVAAFSVASGIEGNRRAWFANLFGLADILVVAGSVALVLLPTITPHHHIMYAVFLPAPLWLWFHLVSIWKLVKDREIPLPTPLVEIQRGAS